MILTPDKELQIQLISEGLSQDETAEYLDIDLINLNPTERAKFDKAWAKGRIQLKIQAVAKLKDAMSGRNGLEAALHVLTRFAEDWPQAEDVTSGIQKTLKLIVD